MASLNKVLMMGNLTRDPELRHTPAGTAVCSFDVASNRSYTGKDGEKQEEVCYITVIVWAKAAENCAQYLKKGRQVLVEGRLQFRSWEDKETKAKRSKHEIVADRVQFLGGPKNGDSAPAPAGEEEVPF